MRPTRQIERLLCVVGNAVLIAAGTLGACGTADAAASAARNGGAITWPDPASHGRNAVLMQVTGGVGITGVLPRPSLTVYDDGAVLIVVGSP